METFSTIRIKKKTACRFRTFSRSHFKTHTESMDGILDFFFYNEISPHERLGPRMGLLMEYLKNLKSFVGKRNSATISIIKEMEKNGVLPTKAMMQLLFEHSPKNNRKASPKNTKLKANPKMDNLFFKSAMDSIEMEKENTTLKQELRRSQTLLINLIDKVKITKSSFGKPKLQLEMTLEDFESLKSSLKTE